MTWPALRLGAENAPPVVFLHGFLGCAEDWQGIAETLAADHLVLCPDLPGHGAHACDDLDTFDAVVESLALWLHAECPGPVSLVGYSQGGRVALAYALRHPDRVSRLVLESASPGLTDAQARASRAEHDYDLAAELDTLEAHSPEFRAWLEGWYAAPLWESLAEQPSLLREAVASRLDSDPRQLALALRAMSLGKQPDFRAVLHALIPPTLLITGERDRKFTVLAEEMAAASPRIARHTMTDCGHNVHLENPGGYTTLLRGFLRH